MTNPLLAADRSHFEEMIREWIEQRIPTGGLPDDAMEALLREAELIKVEFLRRRTEYDDAVIRVPDPPPTAPASVPHPVDTDQ